MDILYKAKDIFKDIIKDNNLIQEKIKISARGLSSEEAIGKPKRTDFPIIYGKEVMIEAEFLGSRGQAFTDAPVQFMGSLINVLDMSLESTHNRALTVAVLNAVLKHLNIANKTIHCKNDEPEQCAKELINWIQNQIKIGDKIGLIGLQPAMLEMLIKTYSSQNVLVSDLNPKNIGTKKYNVIILDGKHDNEYLIDESNFVLITGSSIINGSFNILYKYLTLNNKKFVAFGNTISGVSKLLNIPHFCYYGK